MQKLETLLNIKPLDLQITRAAKKELKICSHGHSTILNQMDKAGILEQASNYIKNFQGIHT